MYKHNRWRCSSWFIWYLLFGGKALRKIFLRGVKRFNSFKTLFSTKLAASEVFVEICRSLQLKTESTELFICKVQVLLAQLWPCKIEIDIIYGLLHRKIKKRLICADINDFNELSRRRNGIELSICPTSSSTQAHDTEILDPKLQFPHKPAKPRWNYCSDFRQLRENYEKLQATSLRSVTTNNSELKSPTVICLTLVVQ